MTVVSRPDWAGRLERLRTSLASRALDGLVVTAPVNVTYLTGFTGTANLLLTPGDVYFITDGRYEFAVREGMAAGTLAPAELLRVERRYDLTLAELVTRLGLTQVGFEAAHVTVAKLSAWQRAASGVAWTPTEDVIETDRLIKDASEIEIFRRAGRMLAGVARTLGTMVREGRTEKDVAGDVDAALIHAGFSRTSFATIVASGPNTALPHARPTDRRIVRGDLVLLDFGGVLDGYCVDLTRMAAAGPPSSDAERLYAAVREAHGAALATVRPGVPVSDVDRAAREAIEARGLGHAVLHATGHGLGLEIHEAPRVGRAETDTPVTTIAPGMVFTIEPGAYVHGLGGVRLEDDVLVTAGGCEVLTDAPRDLLVV